MEGDNPRSQEKRGQTLREVGRLPRGEVINVCGVGVEKCLGNARAKGMHKGKCDACIVRGVPWEDMRSCVEGRPDTMGRL